MELGAIQKQWLSDLRKYPERQVKGRLGSIENGKIEACCLGQGLLTLCEIKGIEPFCQGCDLYDKEIDSKLCDKNVSSSYLTYSYKELGLRNEDGKFITPIGPNNNLFFFYSLADMNDYGVSWLEIADYIEKNPENVFTESL